MCLKAKTVADVENVLDFLLGVILLAKEGDTQEIKDGAFDYARQVLQAAEQPMRALNMYEVTLRAITEGEKLALEKDYKSAFKVLQKATCELMEKSGTTDKLRGVLNKFKSKW